MSVYLSGAAYSCLGVVLAKPAGVSFVQPQGIFLNHPPEVNGSFAIDFEIKGFSKVNWLKSKWFSSDLNRQAENFDLNNWF